MMKFTDAMIDVETLDIADTAVITSVGIQLFNLSGEGWDNNEEAWLYCGLDAQDQINRGRTVSYDTLKWWMTQGNAARSQTFELTQWDFSHVAAAIADVFGPYKQKPNIRLWGNGSGFDLTLIRSLYRTYGMEFPIPFRYDMDLRTLRMIAGNPPYPKTRTGVHHNALDDARYQVLCAQLYWQQIYGE